MPIPAVPAYLNTPYAAKPGQKGGTFIAEDVHDIGEHCRRLSDPDGYRPDRCPHCGRFLQAHGLRPRKLRDQPDSAEELIRRYRCRPCGAVWQVLPGFIARYLHRTWGAVQSAVVAAGGLEHTGSERRVTRKPSTVRRWLRRLGSSAQVLVQALLAVGAEVVAVLKRLGAECTRGELVEGLAREGLIAKERKLEDLACWVHRLAPGLRLM
jgi:transposase-like protein